MKRRSFLVLLGIVAFMAALNAVAWVSTAFCDFYVRNIYPLWLNTYGRIMGMVPFSVGEMMIIIGLIATAAAVIFGLTAVILSSAGNDTQLCMRNKSCAAKVSKRRSGRSTPLLLGFRHIDVYSRIMKICRGYLAGYMWLLAGVFIVMTLNCFIPYHCSSIENKYGLFNRIAADDPLLMQLLAKDYTVEELGQLRDYVVIKTNELAKQVDRDEEGNIIYPENMEEIAIESMQNLSRDCDQLAGFYPKPKQFTFSGFFSQQKMKGYFFPFSLEANYNGLMHEINRPATICHEFAHLKGFLFEDEANLIGFLACKNSSDLTFQYSGYLSILNYVNNEFYDAIGRNNEVYASHVKVSPQVKAENVFLEEKAWKKVEEKAILKTEVVDKVSDKFTQTTLVMNGIEDGALSYTRVVGLLLHYYDDSDEVRQVLEGPEYLVQYNSE